jgi:hypothetical protein
MPSANEGTRGPVAPLEPLPHRGRHVRQVFPATECATGCSTSAAPLHFTPTPSAHEWHMACIANSAWSFTGSVAPFRARRPPRPCTACQRRFLRHPRSLHQLDLARAPNSVSCHQHHITAAATSRTSRPHPYCRPPPGRGPRCDRQPALLAPALSVPLLHLAQSLHPLVRSRA